MTLTEAQVAKLKQPLDPARVKHREGGGGKSLSYLEGHDAVRTANDIFGYGGWGYDLVDLTCIGVEDFDRKDYKTGEVKHGVRVGYRATVSVAVGNIVFTDVGYGDAQEYNGSKITPHELASKEAVTDALKRGLRNLGDQFGLCLYDKFAPEHNGRNGSPSGGDRAVEVQAAESSQRPAPTPNLATFTFPFGKYKGRTIAEVADENPGYLTWLLDNTDKEDIKALIREHQSAGDGASAYTCGFCGSHDETNHAETCPETVPF